MSSISSVSTLSAMADELDRLSLQADSLDTSSCKDAADLRDFLALARFCVLRLAEDAKTNAMPARKKNDQAGAPLQHAA